MTIGEVIRHYRKEKQLTQEAMAGYLGVTAPAVNKWENGNSLPDISLLAPIARLLGISTDTLLSYKEELTDEEIRQKLNRFMELIKAEGYAPAFAWAMENIREYPNCIRLISMLTSMLDAYMQIYNVPDTEKYEEQIYKLYVRCVESTDQNAALSTAVMLVHFLLRKEDYEKAQEYLNRIPPENFNPKPLQAAVYERQGRTEEACALYEQIVFSGFHGMNTALTGMMEIALKQEDMERAEYLADKKKKLAEVLEMGNYIADSPQIALALHSRDKEEILEVLDRMISRIKEVYTFRDSKLYAHMKFSDADTKGTAFMLQKSMENDASLDFLREDARYQKLLRELKELAL